jgi:hypothetical protein
MKTIHYFLGIILVVHILQISASHLKTNAGAPTPYQRAHELLQKMTLDEKRKYLIITHLCRKVTFRFFKVAMVRGYKGNYVGNVIANERLKIPALHLEDGPQVTLQSVSMHIYALSSCNTLQ